MSKPSALDQYVRLSLGLPDPGVSYGEDLEDMAVRAGLRLDSFTSSEQVKMEQVVQERDRQRELAQERVQQQSQERSRGQAPKA